MPLSGPVEVSASQLWFGLSTDAKPGAGVAALGDIFTETDTAYIYYRTPAGWILRDAGSAKVADQTLHAGEPGSGHPLEVSQHWNYAVINANGATVVYSGSCVYGGYQILGNAGAATVNIYDNTAASGQILDPAFTVAAAAVNRRDSGVVCLTGLTVNCSADPTDGLILVFYKAL